MIMGIYMLATVLMAVGETGLLEIWLAFVPGLYEVTLSALIFGFDVAFVAFHHTVRIILLFSRCHGLQTPPDEPDAGRFYWIVWTCLFCNL